MLDVRSLGAVEPICSVRTPQEVTLQFLRTAGRPLSRQALQHRPPSPTQLEEEFLVRTRAPRVTAFLDWEQLAGLSLWALGRENPRGSRKEKAPPSALHPIQTRLLMPGGEQGPSTRKAGEGRLQRGPLLTHLLPAPARGSPQTSSALKTWIFLAMPPRTDIRPSCQVRTAVGLGWWRSGGETQPQPGGGCPAWGLIF